ncbi:MAG: GyrI-like domain-containing protein [Candidatus Tectomicrobia bacterium]|uniref:GyrI-like domain-containing protein n=1 Tax=Tectimicrobiota bacterium TaxID=2528274 RepID=A0A933E8D6_UNCTE|nr:GyrI-like domain-containing protein [Candidatus Tectomicrobia bacterium]
MPAAAVRVEERGPIRGAALAVDGEATPEAVGRTWGRLLLRCEGVPAAGPAFGLRHPDGRYEACWALFPGYPLPTGLREAEAPGGWYAASLHEGPYDRIGEALRLLLEEGLPHGGLRRREGPAVERLLTDPRTVGEADLRTEVLVPVQADPVE